MESALILFTRALNAGNYLRHFVLCFLSCEDTVCAFSGVFSHMTPFWEEQRRPSPDMEAAHTLILNFTASIIARNIYVVYELPGLWYFNIRVPMIKDKAYSNLLKLSKKNFNLFAIIKMQYTN